MEGLKLMKTFTLKMIRMQEVFMNRKKDIIPCLLSFLKNIFEGNWTQILVPIIMMLDKIELS